MNINHSSKEIELDKLEQIERGKRIKSITVINIIFYN